MLPRKRVLIPVFVALTVVLQLMLPALARADDSAPPTDPGTEVVVDPPLETTPTVPEILEQAPEGTAIVVLNADGSLEPLATQAAAEILASGDPVWCPGIYGSGTETLPGGAGCTDTFNTFNGDGDTDPGLLSVLGSKSGDGTIYVANDYDSSLETGKIIDLNHDEYTGLAGLAIQGGWDFTGNTVSGTSDFTLPIFIYNWADGVQISDLIIDLSAYAYDSYGLDVETTGAIDVNAVSVTGAFDGAILDNCTLVDVDPDPDVADWECSTSNPVSVSDSSFDGNTWEGLYVNAGGDVTLDNVSADDNAYGADINSANSIFVQNGSSFDDNDYYGLYATTGSGSLTLTNVDASGNQYGAIAGTDSGNIVVNGGTYNNNTTPDPELDGPGIGLEAGSITGSVTIIGVNASGNNIGTEVGSEQGNVSILTGTYNDNTDTGLMAGSWSGNVTLTDVVASDTNPLDTIEQAFGGLIGSYEGWVEVWGSTFNGNSSKGLYIQSGGQSATDPDVLVNGVTAIGNGYKGVYIEYVAPCGGTTGGLDVNLNSGDFETNGGFGLYAAIGPDGTLTTLAAPLVGDNGGATGPSLYDIVVDNSVFPCPPPEPQPVQLPYQVVTVSGTGDDPVNQDCVDYAGSVLVLPDEDKAVLKCPAAGSLTLTTVMQESLPGAIPQGTGFVSAFQFTLMDGDQPVTVLPPGGTLNLAFKLPEGATPNDHFAILYWDTSARNGAGGWAELPKFMARLDGSPLAFALHPEADPADGMRILSGTRTLGDYVKATVNFTGAFALIKK
jgi:hypothetical protein